MKKKVDQRKVSKIWKKVGHIIAALIVGIARVIYSFLRAIFQLLSFLA